MIAIRMRDSLTTGNSPASDAVRGDDPPGPLAGPIGGNHSRTYGETTVTGLTNRGRRPGRAAGADTITGSLGGARQRTPAGVVVGLGDRCWSSGEWAGVRAGGGSWYCGRSAVARRWVLRRPAGG